MALMTVFFVTINPHQPDITQILNYDKVEVC